MADPAIFQENGGASIGEMMEREGVYWEKGDHAPGGEDAVPSPAGL